MKIPLCILIDSNFFIALRRKQPEALSFFGALNARQLVISALVKVKYAVGEFIGSRLPPAGFFLSAQPGIGSGRA